MASIRTTRVGDVIEIKKTCQIYGSHKDRLFLTNHSNHPLCQYPKITDASQILRPGTKVVVVAKGKAETKYSCSFVSVVHNGITFDIFSDMLPRFFL
jgi:hypothetical protein